MRSHRTARVLIYSHRWLGIVLGLVFVAWFISGVVMIYARMPVLDAGERLARLPAINPATIRTAPPATLMSGGRILLTSLEGRPVFRSVGGGRILNAFADTGDDVPPVDAEQALRIARAFAGGHLTVRYDRRLSDADQWSFHVRGQVPMHRLAVDDGQGTWLYVAENGGDVVTKNSASGRRWGYAGAVVHWLYFTPFRRQAALWSDVVIYLSLAGTVMCAAGLAWGLWRLSPRRHFRIKGHQQWSPYASWMRWHHYAGLIFGAATMMWVFSGMLSMDPWNWQPGTAPTREQRERVAGGSISADELTVDRIRAAVAAFAPRRPKEIAFVKFRGHVYADAVEGIVSLDQPQFGAVDSVPPDLIVGAASVAMPGVAIDGMQWMDSYDAYYYDRRGALPLPVFRVRYGDPQQTWLYFDPRHATIARKEERLSRLNRWLYHGFHSLDVPLLYYRRPLWDIVVIGLSIGGLVLSATTLTAAWRRLRRTVRRYSSWGFGRP